jgi:hypothetical protein
MHRKKYKVEKRTSKPNETEIMLNKLPEFHQLRHVITKINVIKLREGKNVHYYKIKNSKK